MKIKFTLILAAICLVCFTHIGNTAHAESPARPGLRTNTETPSQPGFLPTQPGPQVGGVGQGNPGGFNNQGRGNDLPGANENIMKCEPTYAKTGTRTNSDGATDSMECTSPLYRCPDKNTVKNKYGTAAHSQGLDVEVIPMTVGGENSTQARFKIQYTCTYMWNQG